MNIHLFNHCIYLCKRPCTYECEQNKLDIYEFNNITTVGIYHNNFIVHKEEVKKYTLKK